MSFDTLSFAKRLTEAGEKPAVAEAHAMALKEFVMDTVATKADLKELGRALGKDIEDLRDDVAELRTELAEARSEMREEFTKVRSEMREEFGNVRGEMQAGLTGLRIEMLGEIGKLRDETQKQFASARDETQKELVGVRGEIADLRQDFTAFRKEVGERFATKDELRSEIGLLRKDIDAMGLKLTVRMGGMLAVAVGAVATLGKVF